MTQLTYTTGRHYGTAQVLALTVLSCDVDEFGDATVRFDDSSRSISGTVRIFAMEAQGYPRDVGAAVLREYDAGRYTLA
jgi:hypothetical protein